MTRFITSFLFAAVAGLTLMASEPFIGTLHNTKGQPLRGIKVYLNASRDAVKSDKNGEFTLDSVLTDDVLHINYKGKIQDVVVTDKSKIHLIVGKDNRIFEKETYTGESFHGTLLNHKGKGIRGAMVYASDPFDYVKSNRDGEFVLDNVHTDDTIHVRYNDYIHDIAIDGSKGMYIIIGRSNGRRANDDRVRMGAGTMSVREYNGPLDVLTAERLEATGESSLYKALLRCPGIGTRYVNGESRLSIRASNFDPLWVVDGVEMRSFPDLTVMEVKRVDILKDGAAYGTRGAGGVIVVTTKGSEF